MKRTLLYMALCIAPFFSSCSKDDETIEESTPQYKLEGMYSLSDDGFIISIEGDKAPVISFGTHRMGTNPSLFNIGSPYLRNITPAGTNKWSGELAKSEYRFDNTELKDILKSIEYVPVEITRKDAKTLDLSPNNNWEYSWDVYDPNASGGGNNGGGGGGGTGACIEGTWYSTSCGDSKGTIWKFNSNGTGSFSNKDCNGICNPIVFKFSYTISGSTCSIKYNAQQDVVKCSGYPDTAPPKPRDESFTFTCSGTKLTVNSGSGSNTFTK